MIPTVDELADLSPEQTRKRQVADALAGLVSARFMAASTHKQPVTELIERARRIMKMEPVTGKHIDPEIPVVYPIAPPIVEGLIALLSDAIQVSDAAETFVMKPSPIVELPEDVNTRILDELRQQQQHLAEMGIVPSYDELVTSAAHLEAAARLEQQQVATEQAKALQMKVKDQLSEGGFTAVLDELVRDFCTYPAAVIKSPATLLKQVRTWEGGRLAFVQKLVRGVQRVDPGLIFPAPGAAGMQPENSEYVIELRRLIPSELAELGASPEYDYDEVMRALVLYPSGHQETYAGLPGYLDPGVNGTSAVSLAPASAGGTYDAVVHWGRIQGQHLEAFGVTVPDPLRSYEAEVVCVGKCVIRAALNPNPSGRRPYNHTSFFPVSGEVWGTSPCLRLADMQRAATSLFITLLADAALAGIHIELDPTFLSDKDKVEPSAIRPRQVRIVKQSGAGNRARAYDIFNVQAQIATFSTEIEKLHAVCFELVGVSRLSLGQQAGAGTIGRTAQGVSALLNQTTKPIKKAVLSLEAHIIEPTVQSFADFNLTWARPGEFSGDVAVMARGLSGLLEQQGNVGDLQFVLQSVTSLAGQIDATTGQPVIPPDTIPALLSKIFAAKGIDPTGIFNRDYTLAAALKGTSADQTDTRLGGGFGQYSLGTQAAPAAPAVPAQPPAAPAAVMPAPPTQGPTP